jgi:hypothetical protein
MLFKPSFRLAALEVLLGALKRAAEPNVLTPSPKTLDFYGRFKVTFSVVT